MLRQEGQTFSCGAALRRSCDRMVVDFVFLYLAQGFWARPDYLHFPAIEVKHVRARVDLT